VRSFLLISFVALISSCREPEVFDFSLSAAEGRDVSAIVCGAVEGCHNGYVFIRKNVGDSLDYEISLHIPEVRCSRQSCALVQFLTKDGSKLGVSVSIPKDKDSVSVKLSDIVGRAGGVEEQDNAEYRFFVRLWFQDKDDAEFVVDTQGLLRLWVVDEDYTELACGDPEKGWSKKVLKDCTADFSTGFRTALCGSCDFLKREVFN